MEDRFQKFVNKIVKRVLISLVLLVVLVLAIVYGYLWQSKPRLNGNITLDGLRDEVSVKFDAWGVPHINAQNEEDAYQVFGYLHAQDRLFQMELLRRAASGRLAEVLGPDLIEVDKLFRTLGLNRFAKYHSDKYLSGDSAAWQRAVHAYIRGVNQYITHGKTPVEFSIIGIPKTEFTTTDIYYVIGYMALGFAEGFEVDPVVELINQKWGPSYLSDLAVNTPSDAEIIPIHTGKPKLQNAGKLISSLHNAFATLPVPLIQGSNGWVVGGTRSSSGFPILSNDTHIGFSQPAVWYEAHITYPGVNFYGHHLAGLPFGVLGNNDFCGWGLTMFENDDVDFFIEELNPANTDQVRFGDHWEELAIRKEIIKVKGQEDIELTVRESRHGPLVNGIVENVDETQPISLSWLLLKRDNHALEGTYRLGRAKTFEEAEQAIAMFDAPGLNFMYGDTDGNIAWWARGILPIRPAHTNGKLFLDGASGADEYQGFYDNSFGPRSINPPSGFVYSANNQPDTINGVFHSGYYFPRSRAGRIVELLKRGSKYSVEDMKAIVLDDVSAMHAELAASLASMIPASDDETVTAMQKVLSAWKGEHHADAAGPVVYYNILSHLLKNTLEDEIGPDALGALLKTALIKNSIPMLLNNAASPWWDDVHTDSLVETRREIIAKSVADAAEVIRQTCGREVSRWKWSKVHTLTHNHPLGSVKPLDKFFNVGPLPAAGGSEVINNLDFIYSTDGHFHVTSGPALRKITDFGNIEGGITVSPTGQSGNVMSPHYKDQAEMFVKGEFRPMLMDAEQIDRASRNELTFTPRAE